jgi:hypothetical protein
VTSMKWAFDLSVMSRDNMPPRLRAMYDIQNLPTFELDGLDLDHFVSFLFGPEEAIPGSLRSIYGLLRSNLLESFSQVPQDPFDLDNYPVDLDSYPTR